MRELVDGLPQLAVHHGAKLEGVERSAGIDAEHWLEPLEVAIADAVWVRVRLRLTQSEERNKPRHRWHTSEEAPLESRISISIRV